MIAVYDNRDSVDKHTRIDLNAVDISAHNSTEVTLTYLIDWRLANTKSLLSEFNINEHVLSVSLCASGAMGRCTNISRHL